MLREAASDICAFASFPTAHWKKVWSTNPLERVNKEIKRRTNVVGVFQRGWRAAPGRIDLLEVHDEWQIASGATCPKDRWRSSTPATDRVNDKEVGADTKELLAG